MSKLFSTFLGCLIFTSTLFSGAIFETAHFKELVSHIQLDSIVLIDIDETIFTPTQTLGSDIWFQYRQKQHEGTGLTKMMALEKALAEWEAIRHITNVKLVEEGTEKIIADLQNKKVAVMGMTVQGIALATRTVQQLKSLNIDLTKTAPSQDDHYFINKHGVLYRHGILFTSGTPKGAALLSLLDRFNLKPRQIVLIDDKLEYLKDVQAAVEARGIEFIGLRYGYSDKRVANFKKEIADIQWEMSTFHKLLSDQEAEELLNRV